MYLLICLSVYCFMSSSIFIFFPTDWLIIVVTETVSDEGGSELVFQSYYCLFRIIHKVKRKNSVRDISAFSSIYIFFTVQLPTFM